MGTSRFVSSRVRLCCSAAFAFALMSASASAQATNASLQGTYTLLFGAVEELWIQTNMFGQEVGFCEGGQTPYGYSCMNVTLSEGTFTGTLVADGDGNITSGSTYTYATDPNSYECSSKYQGTPDCPYQVPSGISWSSSTSYAVGDEVDYGGKTYQAVKTNTGAAPGGSNVCTAATAKNPPKCTWDQLYQSANGNSGQSGSMSGTYSVQSSGLGTMQLTVVTSSRDITLTYTILVPALSAVGQEVSLAASPPLGGGGPFGSGTAERIK